MGEFAAVLRRRLEDEYASLDAARSADDDNLSEALLAEIENLRRIAADHGVPLPVARQPLSRPVPDQGSRADRAAR